MFRANFGTERNGQNLLAEGVFSKGSEIKDGYPEFTADLLKKLGWWEDLTPEEKKAAEGRNWKTDLSGGIQRVAIKHGCAPFGNAKARCVVWNFPDPVPLHREPLYTPRYDLVSRYPTYADRQAFWRLPTRYRSIQSTDHSKKYPLAFISGRLVEYEGGGEETRSNAWLAKLQPEMFVEINPVDANNNGARTGATSGWKARRAGASRCAPWSPNEWGRVWCGPRFISAAGSRARTWWTATRPAAPYVRGEACNTATTYGYDSVTQMQETKGTLCRIYPA